MFASTNPGNSSQRITREQAEIAHTRGSAFAEHAEHSKGTPAAGILADPAVLSQDIFTVPPPVLPGTTSVLTMVRGRITRNELTSTDPDTRDAVRLAHDGHDPAAGS